LFIEQNANLWMDKWATSQSQTTPLTFFYLVKFITEHEQNLSKKDSFFLTPTHPGTTPSRRHNSLESVIFVLQLSLRNLT